MCEKCSKLNIDTIKNAKTKYLGKNTIYYKEIGSTQDEIRKLAQAHVENGTLVVTDNQTAGKGTKGRNWFAEGGKNITMSFVIYPNCQMSQLESLTIDIAEAIVKTIQELYGYKLTIKQPNDVLLNGKKICGILTQSSTINEKINFVIIGIGFNVNQEVFEEEIKEIATSLKKEYGKEFEREKIIAKFLENLEKTITTYVLKRI